MIPFRFALNHIYLEASINGSEPLVFALDSGAQASVLDSEVAKRMGLPLQPTGMKAAGVGDTTYDIERTHDVHLSFGETAIQLPEMLVGPFGTILSQMTGFPVSGALGYDVFSRYAIEIDYSARVLMFHTGYPEAHAVPLELSENHPHVRAKIQIGHRLLEADLVVDTGAFHSMSLFSTYLNKHDVAIERRAVMVVEGIGGFMEQGIGIASQVLLGDECFSDVPILYTESGDEALAQYLKADGIIGADILNRYRVIFDYQTSRLILHPSPRTGMPFHYNRDGMLYKRLGETSPAITIASVAAGSAGARAGLRAGDRLVAIDGASTETIEIDSIYERFRHPGEYQLSILRDVEMIDIVLVLADNPPTPHV